METCVADTIRAVHFPKPGDGGTVQVTSQRFTFKLVPARRRVVYPVE